jgi:hypothetical protein
MRYLERKRYRQNSARRFSSLKMMKMKGLIHPEHIIINMRYSMPP